MYNMNNNVPLCQMEVVQSIYLSAMEECYHLWAMVNIR